MSQAANGALGQGKGKAPPQGQAQAPKPPQEQGQASKPPQGQAGQASKPPQGQASPPPQGQPPQKQCYSVEKNKGSVTVTPLPAKTGGNPKPTPSRVMVGGRNSIVYKGSRGGKYVKKGGEFVPLSKIK
jgi:hypothetical protein